MSARRYELGDFEWSIIKPLLPNKPRGVVRADDRKVSNGIYWRLRTGSPWADIPERYGPPTTCYNRFVRWRKLGAWDRIFEAVSLSYDGDLQMVDSSSIRVHQHAANVKKTGLQKLATTLTPDAWGARGGGLTTKACPRLRVMSRKIGIMESV
jgi:transposase